MFMLENYFMGVILFGAKPRSGSFCFPSLMFEQNPEFEIVSES